MKRILIKSPPRTGKSTLLNKIQNKLRNEGINYSSCIVNEILYDDTRRKGFEMILSSNGCETNKIILADKTRTDWIPMIGSFYVNLDGIEELIEWIKHVATSSGIVVIFDEIGKMQHLNENFLESVDLLLESGKIIIGTLVYDDVEWSLRYKNDPLNDIITLDAENRNNLPDELFMKIKTSIQ